LVNFHPSKSLDVIFGSSPESSPGSSPSSSPGSSPDSSPGSNPDSIFRYPHRKPLMSCLFTGCIKKQVIELQRAIVRELLGV
jgi:hypothetical protein